MKLAQPCFCLVYCIYQYILYIYLYIARVYIYNKICLTLTLAFTSADSLIIHSALLEIHSKSEIILKKGIFVTYFPFFNRLTALQLPPPRLP